MFDEIDKKPENWVIEVVSGLKISFDISADELDKSDVCIYLLDVSPAPPGRGVRLPPLQIMLRYLVFPCGSDPKETHQLLGKLLISALENGEFEIENKPPPIEIWQAFGIVPKPAHTSVVPFKYERKEKLAPNVRYPLTIKQTVLENLQGKVSVNQIPMADVKIDIPLLKIYTKTDNRGFFQFSSLPSQPTDKNLLIRVKQHQFSVFTSQAERLGNLLLFDLKLEE